MTFAELEERSAALSAWLVQVGVVKGSRVGVLFPNGIDWVTSWAAAARLGAVTVPVNTFYKAPELARFMRHADVQFLLGVSSFMHHDYVARLEDAAPELSTHGPGPLYLQSLPQLRRVVLWGSDVPSWAHPGPSESSWHVGPAYASIVRAMGDDVTPDDEMLVTYTSGSTGEPKGVVHSHGAIIRHASNLAALSGVDQHSRIWTPMPFCWVGGFVFCLLRALVAGGCLLTQEYLEPGAALQLLSREGVTEVNAWPGVTKAMLEHPTYAETDFSNLQKGWYEALPPDRRPSDLGAVVNSLGMSETCGPHTFRLPGEDVTGAPPAYRGSFGHEVPGTEHRIVDPETGIDLPEGEEGEVLVRGYNLMLGLHRCERAETFDSDGWYHTGDRGYFRDGWFFFTGRQTDLIKTGGSNVAPAEVEDCLMSYDDVKLAFVVGIPDEVRGQEVVALVVPWNQDTVPGAPPAPDGEDLRERLRAELSTYKIPRHVLVISDDLVPWLVSQKVDRRALVTLAQDVLTTADESISFFVSSAAAHRSAEGWTNWTRSDK